jgi:hypothetical protein
MSYTHDDMSNTVNTRPNTKARRINDDHNEYKAY